MLSMILTVTMTSLQPAAPQTARVQPCVWPNTCVEQPVAKIQPCVWPNTCVETPTVATTYTTCKWPNTCATNG